MIREVIITNYLGETLTLNLFKPEEHGIIIKDITGLSPAKATINTTSFATDDGAIFNSARVDLRNIVMSLEFGYRQSIEDVRQLVYKYFPIKRELTFRIKTDNRDAETIGYVESNDVTIFSQAETAQISIICPSAYFYAADKVTTTNFYGIEPNFEFPFSNESLSEPLLEMGFITRLATKEIIYEGDAETGMIMSIHAVGEVKNITIYNVETRAYFKINTDKLPNGVMEENDTIIISTVKGAKTAALLRDGVTTNIFNAIDRGSTWLQLHKGTNLIAFEAEEGDLNLQFSVTNQILYEGV